MIGQQYARTFHPVPLGQEPEHAPKLLRAGIQRLIWREPRGRGEDMVKAEFPPQADRIFAGRGGRQHGIDPAVGDLA